VIRTGGGASLKRRLMSTTELVFCALRLPLSFRLLYGVAQGAGKM